MNIWEALYSDAFHFCVQKQGESGQLLPILNQYQAYPPHDAVTCGKLTVNSNSAGDCELEQGVLPL